MPIQEQNIVFVESQVMDDVPEGGGAATGRVITDGQMNNVFEDISDLDRAYGRFNLRKIFLAVRTLSTDLYGGAKTVITALPTDDALGYTLFSSNDPFDTRSQAANRVEAYLYKGPLWNGYLYENHITGMRAINLLMRIGSPLPTIGKTLCLVQDEGLAGQKEQYVRITKVAAVERSFEDTQGAFTRWVVTLDLSDALRFDFTGFSASRIDTNLNYTGKTRIRNTTVADAARYYGAQRLATAATIGDLQVRAASMFTKLVPSAQTETPLVNQLMAPEIVATYSAGARTVEVAQQAHTRALAVTAENRRLNWIETLLPIPAPGALSVSYMAQGNWYTLTDGGSGTVSGSDPTLGAGTINYTTGALSVTLGALPDAGSQVMITWASPVHYTQRTGASADAAATVDLDYTLASAPVVPGTVSITYPVSGATRTVTDPSSNGVLSGTGVSGTIDYATGKVALRFTTPPDPGSNVSNAYTQRSGTGLVTDSASATISGGQFTVSGTAPFRSAGTMLFQFSAVAATGSAAAYVTSGGAVRIAGQKVTLSNGTKGRFEDQAVGTFNTATGVVTLAGTPTMKINEWDNGAWVDDQPAAVTLTAVSNISIERDTAAFDPLAVSGEQVAVGTAGVALRLLTTIADDLVANSLRFATLGKTYEDRNGTLYADIDPGTGSGTPAGTIDYSTGRATITFWTAGSSSAVTVDSCLTRFGDWLATDASFRAPFAPIKPEALSIVATSITGEALQGAANADGIISGPKMRGAVNYEFGTATLEFGTLAGEVWTPLEVIPDTIRYNAVAYSYLPLDADILGIDPVRLPSDGRVPIYRPGDVVMVMHTDETAPATVANGGTIDCGRTRIGWIRVVDATGASITSGYTLDRATGIVTFVDVSGMTMPIKVRHTVGDLRQITDAQISGQLTLARPLSHTYPANESIVASCLIHGDRRARVSAVWDQATWDGTWSDSLVGSEATATLDTIAHPITVTNEGAETERWLLRWTSTTNVELIGERRGLVYSGPFTADIAPINPRTRNEDGTGGEPYLRIPAAANGGGWSAGNVVRINTVGALADIWIARSIQQSDEPLGDGADGVELYALGNIDRP